MKDTQGVTASLLHPENRPERTLEGRTFTLADIRRAFCHGVYAGHANARTRMSHKYVVDAADKYVAMSPHPLLIGATIDRIEAA